MIRNFFVPAIVSCMATFIIVISLLSCSTDTQKGYLLRGQSEDFPIYTVLDSATIYPQIQRLSTSSSLALEELDSFLAIIEPHLEEEDALAMLGFYMVYSNELVTFLKSPRTEEKNEYLVKLADKNCSTAELIIVEDYYKGINSFKSSPDKALKYLEGAIVHGDKLSSSFGNLIMADIYSDPNNTFNLAVDSTQALECLRLVLESDDTNIKFMAKMKLPKLYKKLDE